MLSFTYASFFFLASSLRDFFSMLSSTSPSSSTSWSSPLEPASDTSSSSRSNSSPRVSASSSGNSSSAASSPSPSSIIFSHAAFSSVNGLDLPRNDPYECDTERDHSDRTFRLSILTLVFVFVFFGDEIIVVDFTAQRRYYYSSQQNSKPTHRPRQSGRCPTRHCRSQHTHPPPPPRTRAPGP